MKRNREEVGHTAHYLGVHDVEEPDKILGRNVGGEVSEAAQVSEQNGDLLELIRTQGLALFLLTQAHKGCANATQHER